MKRKCRAYWFGEPARIACGGYDDDKWGTVTAMIIGETIWG